MISLRSAREFLEERGDDLPTSNDERTVIIGFNFHTITFLGDGTLNDLTISQRGSGRWFAVNCAGGSPKLTKCDCSGATSSVIGICGGSTPIISGCKIHGSEHGCGVVVFQGGKGELNENEIFQNAMSGIEVLGEESEPALQSNRIHSNRGDGVLIYDSAKCTLTGNTIEKNFHAGTRQQSAPGRLPLYAAALVVNARRPAGRRCRCFPCSCSRPRAAGVEVRDKAFVTARENTVSCNNFGVIIARHASGVLESNRVTRNFITVHDPPPRPRSPAGTPTAQCAVRSMLAARASDAGGAGGKVSSRSCQVPWLAVMDTLGMGG